MKKIFTVVSLSALTMVNAFANSSDPASCVANNLTLRFNTNALNFDTDGVTSRLKSQYVSAPIFAAQDVSVGASIRLPGAGTGFEDTITYIFNGQSYNPGDSIVIPETTETELSVEVSFVNGAMAKAMILQNDAVRYFNAITVFYTEDPSAQGGYRMSGLYANQIENRNLVNIVPVPDGIQQLFSAMGTEPSQFLERSGARLRGLIVSDATGYLEQVSSDSGFLYEMALGGIAFPTQSFDTASFSTMKIPYVSGELKLASVFATNCNAETTVSACDAANPTKPICLLDIGGKGEAIYTNSCCTGYHISETTTE